MNGRHRRVLLIMAVQYCMDIRPEIRSQLDVVIACRENMAPVRTRLYEQVGSGSRPPRRTRAHARLFMQFFGFFKSFKGKCSSRRRLHTRRSATSCR